MKRISVKVVPAERKDHLNSLDKCLYGVSVGAVNMRIADVLDGYRWASANFKRCCILLGDSLYRFTIQIQKDVSAKDAERLAKASGQQLVEQILSRITRLPEIIRCSDVRATPRFIEYVHEIMALYSKNAGFRDSISSDALCFIKRQAQKGRLSISEEASIELATSYLIEEIAIYGCLAEQGWLVDVYLGDELPSLAKISCNEIPGFEGAITQRINISLRLR